MIRIDRGFEDDSVGGFIVNFHQWPLILALAAAAVLMRQSTFS
jgi:hypothetical protein